MGGAAGAKGSWVRRRSFGVLLLLSCVPRRFNRFEVSE